MIFSSICIVKGSPAGTWKKVVLYIYSAENPPENSPRQIVKMCSRCVRCVCRWTL